MAIAHHPDDATLMSYAAGSLPEALCVVIACHVAMCPACRREMEFLEKLGAGLIDGLAGSELSRPSARIETALASPNPLPGPLPGPLLGPLRRRPKRPASGDVPVLLAPIVGPRLDAIQWSMLAPGVWHHPLPVSKKTAGNVRLIKVAPGQNIPEHGHGGSELTLLLKGSYRDEMGHFGVGDIADHDEDVEHRPVADPFEGCVCLIASERKAKFKSVLARMIQPLTGL